MSDFSEDGFESDGSWDLDSDSSGPQIDRYPRVRKGRILRFCRQCGHHQYWGEGWCFGCGWVRTHRRWRTERFPGFGKGNKGKKAREQVAPTVERGRSPLDADETALGPNPQEPAPQTDPPPTDSKKAPPPPPPSGDGGPKTKAPPTREGFFDTLVVLQLQGEGLHPRVEVPYLQSSTGGQSELAQCGDEPSRVQGPT